VDWGQLDEERVAAVRELSPWDPVRMVARLEGAFGLRHLDSERAARIANEELDRAQLRGNEHAVARAYLVLNYTVREAWDPEEMFDRLEDAFEVFGRLDDAWGRIRAADLLATIAEGMGDYPTALRFTQVTLDDCRRTGERLFLAYGLSSMAGILTAAGDLEGAGEQLDEALQVAEPLGVDRLSARLLVRKSRVERALGHTDACLRLLDEALQRAKRSDAEYTEIESLTELAHARAHLGQPTEAEAIYEQALALLDGEMLALLGPSVLLGLAQVCLDTDRPSRAAEHAERLVQLAQRYGMVPKMAEGTKLLSEAHHRLEDFPNAYRHLAQHLKLREAMMKGEAERAVKRQQVIADLAAAKKDAEIHRLRYVELEAMQTQLVESERMAVVGSLTAGLTHEMNTPLGVVRSSLGTTTKALEKLTQSLPEDRSRAISASLTALETAASTSHSALDRLEALVRSLRRFTRLDEAEYQQLDLVECLGATLDVFASQLPAGVQLQSDLRSTPLIHGWPGALNQAFMTLLRNAAEALGNRGTIRVSTETTATGTEASVVIADDGPGIPEPTRQRLFDLELSRDGPRARFRIGLATVRSVMDRHRARIELDTEVGGGTSFQLVFPVEIPAI
jgi:signal transduction histidine kinase